MTPPGLRSGHWPCVSRRQYDFSAFYTLGLFRLQLDLDDDLEEMI